MMSANSINARPNSADLMRLRPEHNLAKSDHKESAFYKVYADIYLVAKYDYTTAGIADMEYLKLDPVPKIHYKGSDLYKIYKESVFYKRYATTYSMAKLAHRAAEYAGFAGRKVEVWQRGKTVGATILHRILLAPPLEGPVEAGHQTPLERARNVKSEDEVDRPTIISRDLSIEPSFVI